MTSECNQLTKHKSFIIKIASRIRMYAAEKNGKSIFYPRLTIMKVR